MSALCSRTWRKSWHRESSQRTLRWQTESTSPAASAAAIPFSYNTSWSSSSDYLTGYVTHNEFQMLQRSKTHTQVTDSDTQYNYNFYNNFKRRQTTQFCPVAYSQNQSIKAKRVWCLFYWPIFKNQNNYFPLIVCVRFISSSDTFRNLS